MEARKQVDLQVLLDLKGSDPGASYAYDTLLSDYRPLISSLTASFVSSCMADPLEVRVEAEYALYRAALSFDVSRGMTTFGLYAKVCIRNRLISHFSRGKQRIVPLSLDTMVEEDGLEEVLCDPKRCGDTLLDEEAFRQLCDKIRGILSPYEADVFFLWADSYTRGEIAKKLGKDEKSVSNAIDRSVAKLRSVLS